MLLLLPPPMPSCPKPAPASSSSSSSQPAQPDITVYYSGGGGCFGAQSSLTIARGKSEYQVQECDVRVRDLVKVADGFARIRCVVRIAHKSDQPMVLLPGDLQITPSHPVRIDGAWRRPRDLPSGQCVSISDEFVYNFVLDTPGSVLIVNGIECVTLGHGLQADVVRHAFYGSNAVLTALERIHGWDQGFVSVECIRDVDGHVCGL
jgi:hypothetical protein